ncbi:molybdopterin-guanine dinucleotide biosynthesis protein B [Pelosinus propionicus]|uniref:Molybdopterin guanine dinucleotide biosynthesis accessory protein MobB n=1 Tax=Pelosinus propionicus DSM 13327 TaxID=1123291 RepID=A0A1I4MWA5_9FIRM|nr:molybdopterin-guanine dinucleotide biosynthesis protein B [Pelosinus propionicus]SFM07263.1 molybdopterin guanine dinucleotide biosynthesis accessory protein MobB [Pelosinus propionicus DSM 13327]
MIPIISFVGYSNSGKTTLLTKVIRELKNRGYRIAVIKHDGHDFEIDHTGTDTWKHRQAGADVVCIASARQVATVQTLAQPLGLDDIIQGISNVDLILTEGFKQEEKPQIEVHRQGIEYIGLNKNRIALVAEQQVYTGVPYFKLEEVKEVADFLENRI